MLTISIKGSELYDERTDRFIVVKPTTLRLEHSLISLSKWESKWHKPFLGADRLSMEEELDYIRCMCIDRLDDPNILRTLTQSDYEAIRTYINDPMTATTFSNRNRKASREIVTNELIYYWMVALEIPFECEKWHLNRLLTLIKVCELKNAPKKKMSKKDQMAQQRSLNAARRASHNSRG